MLQKGEAGDNGEPSDFMVGERLHGWGFHRPIKQIDARRTLARKRHGGELLLDFRYIPILEPDICRSLFGLPIDPSEPAPSFRNELLIHAGRCPEGKLDHFSGIAYANPFAKQSLA
jgi:hypothetical protein